MNTHICHKESFRTTERIREEEENKLMGCSGQYCLDPEGIRYPRSEASVSQWSPEGTSNAEICKISLTQLPLTEIQTDINGNRYKSTRSTFEMLTLIFQAQRQSRRTQPSPDPSSSLPCHRMSSTFVLPYQPFSSSLQALQC